MDAYQQQQQQLQQQLQQQKFPLSSITAIAKLPAFPETGSFLNWNPIIDPLLFEVTRDTMDIAGSTNNSSNITTTTSITQDTDSMTTTTSTMTTTTTTTKTLVLIPVDLRTGAALKDVSPAQIAAALKSRQGAALLAQSWHFSDRSPKHRAPRRKANRTKTLPIESQRSYDHRNKLNPQTSSCLNSRERVSKSITIGKPITAPVPRLSAKDKYHATSRISKRAQSKNPEPERPADPTANPDVENKRGSFRDPHQPNPSNRTTPTNPPRKDNDGSQEVLSADITLPTSMISVSSSNKYFERNPCTEAWGFSTYFWRHQKVQQSFLSYMNSRRVILEIPQTETKKPLGERLAESCLKRPRTVFINIDCLYKDTHPIHSGETLIRALGFLSDEFRQLHIVVFATHQMKPRPIECLLAYWPYALLSFVYLAEQQVSTDMNSFLTELPSVSSSSHVLFVDLHEHEHLYEKLLTDSCVSPPSSPSPLLATQSCMPLKVATSGTAQRRKTFYWPNGHYKDASVSYTELVLFLGLTLDTRRHVGSLSIWNRLTVFESIDASPDKGSDHSGAAGGNRMSHPNLRSSDSYSYRSPPTFQELIPELSQLDPTSLEAWQPLIRVYEKRLKYS